MKHQKFTLFVGHNCELSSEFSFAFEDLLILVIVLILENAAYDVDHTKVISLINIDVFCVFVFWQDEPSGSFFEEVHASNFITFEENVLVLCGNEWSQNREYPCDKGR